ncbi:MAG: DUF1800 domain-containing protein [Planctomycetes bacterium]|nr:DUF1800 domain-containing protein [Planctomycetota bacterium]
MPQARHLLHRAGFGGTPKQIDAVHEMGLDGAVNFLVDYDNIDVSHLGTPRFDPDIMKPVPPEQRMAAQAARRENDKAEIERLRMLFLQRQAQDLTQMRRIEQWWLSRMIESPRPLEEKLTLLWHGHFATNHRTIHDSWLMLEQNRFFRQNAAGNFADLARGIVRDPAMIHFLNNDSNRKMHPNENLARELMELFTLGEGHYSEQDIKEGARALTGNTADDNDFAFNARAHDTGEKTILGQRGTFDGEGFVRVLLNRPECPLFIARKLYRHFVGDINVEPDPAQAAAIIALAKSLVENRYELRPVLKTLFSSKHFYDPRVMGSMVKSPAQLLVGTVRTLDTPPRDLDILTEAMAMMGQKLFDPPSVAGWDGGRGWINTSTLFVRQNVSAYLVAGKLPYEDGWSRDSVNYSPMFVIEGLKGVTPAAVVDRTLSLLIGAELPPERRAPLVEFVNSRKAGVTPDVMVGLLLLVTAMPEYQLC